MLKKFYLLIFLVLSFICIATIKTLALNYSTGMSANVVIGQTDFTHGSENAKYPTASSIWYSKNIATDGTHFFVADDFNNRVLIYNSIPTSTNQAADVVIGQKDMTHNESNQGQPTPGANTLSGPKSITTDGTHLIVVDSQNYRILIYNSIPTSNNASADVVLGQSDMQSKSILSTAANTFDFSPSVNIDPSSGKLIVTDMFNNRVLIYNSIPSSNFASANVVLGQTNFSNNSRNQGGTDPTANTLQTPTSSKVIQNKLFVSDNGNNRVLIYNTIPASNNASANTVIGQANMTSWGEVPGPTDHTMISPQGIEWDGSKLYITDSLDNRIFVYNSIPVTNGASANDIFGQPDFTTITSGLSSTKLNSPYDIVITGGKMFVADASNNRILVFGNYTISKTATFTLGQSDFTSGFKNGYSNPINSNGFDYAYGLATDGTHLFVTDSTNNRVLLFNSIPSSNNPSADVVIGQQNMISGGANQGGSVTANTLQTPSFIDTNGTKLFIADSGNNRVLIYNSIPNSNNPAADVVIGQQNMTDSTSNQGGTAAANTLNDPISVNYDSSSGKLVVSDCMNNRVLIYNTVPTSNNSSANVVVGQTNFSNTAADAGGSVSENGIHCPTNAKIINNKLFIVDNGNSRILIYNTVPTSNGATADVAIGQPDMSGSSSDQGGTVQANTLDYPTDVLWDGSHLLIQDDGNNRVLIYNSIPTSNNASADLVLGQTSLNEETWGTSSTTFNDPEGQLAFANNKLFVGDSSNNRVVIFSDYISQSSTSTNTSSSDNLGYCSNFPPQGSPHLFQINSYINSAILYFAPSKKPYNKYIISYGLTPLANSHSTIFDQNDSTGAIKYVINDLTKNSKYYYKVRAANGCATGEWSNILSSTTTRIKSTKPNISTYFAENNNKKSLKK